MFLGARGKERRRRRGIEILSGGRGRCRSAMARMFEGLRI